MIECTYRYDKGREGERRAIRDEKGREGMRRRGSMKDIRQCADAECANE